MRRKRDRRREGERGMTTKKTLLIMGKATNLTILKTIKTLRIMIQMVAIVVVVLVEVEVLVGARRAN